jgi:hypothetical protein
MCLLRSTNWVYLGFVGVFRLQLKPKRSLEPFIRGTSNVVPSLPIIVILMMEAIRSYETSVLTRATRRNTTQDTISQSQHRENLKSYITLTDLAL